MAARLLKHAAAVTALLVSAESSSSSTAPAQNSSADVGSGSEPAGADDSVDDASAGADDVRADSHDEAEESEEDSWPASSTSWRSSNSSATSSRQSTKLVNQSRQTDGSLKSPGQSPSSQEALGENKSGENNGRNSAYVEHVTSAELAGAFLAYVQSFARKYDVEELPKRLAAFTANYIEIQQSNQNANLYYKLSVNRFTDMTDDEFAVRLGRHSAGKMAGGAELIETPEAEQAPMRLRGSQRSVNESALVLPEAVNWTASGVVTPVKDQGACGGCWAFAAAGALEGARALESGELVGLSVQQFLDCSAGDDYTSGVPNMGCAGGLEYNGWEYAHSHSICTEGSYPYRAFSGWCTDDCSMGLSYLDVLGWRRVPAGNPQALLEAVAHQPVSIGVNGRANAFKFYSSGIIDEACAAELDHSVLLVGYGEDNGMKYWLVKNSWGTDWGEYGYVRVRRYTGLSAEETPPSGGKCGLLLDPSYPVLVGQKRRLSRAAEEPSASSASVLV